MVDTARTAFVASNGRIMIMKTKANWFFAWGVVVANLIAAPIVSSQTERFSASLIGLNEVPPINTEGTADFGMTIQPSGITFSLNFSGLTSPLAVAHMHFGVPNVNGGVMIFLCGGGGQPACPATTSGTITGTITAANVTGPVTQNVPVGDLDTALKIVRLGASYANMHTANFGSGEIRGQVSRGAGH